MEQVIKKETRHSRKRHLRRKKVKRRKVDKPKRPRCKTSKSLCPTQGEEVTTCCKIPLPVKNITNLKKYLKH